VYQLLKYVINEQLKKMIVQTANILGPGQGGGRQGRCVGTNMQKMHFIQQEVRDRAREFIGSTLTLKTTSTPYLKQHSGG